MANMPVWYSQLRWSGPLSVAKIQEDRDIIPTLPGCYVFTVDPGPLVVGRSLYVGMASASLRKRVASYLVDFRRYKKAESHKGKGFVLEARHDRGDHGVYLRWIVYGGSKEDISILEANLIHLLEPEANDRDEDAHHPLFSHKESLNLLLLQQRSGHLENTWERRA
jgi:excinuclease UvrABC nuclease subunit